jgi:hypothetical protein
MGKRVVKTSQESGPPEPAAQTRPTGKGAPADVHRKLVAFDSETWHAVNLLGRDTFMTFQELADEAFHDLLRKHGRPVELRDQLKQSAKAEDGRRKTDDR